MNDGCWYAIVRSEKTHTVACNECFGMQWITGPQRIPRADVPSCGQKRHTRWPATNASACNELRMRYSTRTYPWVLPDNRRISMRTCSSMDFETTIRLHKLSGFGKPPILCVNPGYLSKPYKNFGFGYVGYLVCLSVCLCLYPSISLFVLVSNYLSMCPCIYLSVSPSMSLAVPLTISLSVRLSIYLFIYRSVCPSIYVSSYVSIYLSTYLCVYLSVYLSIYLSIDLSIYLSLSLSISPSIYLSLYVSI